MGDASLTGHHLRRTFRFRFLRWRAERNRDIEFAAQVIEQSLQDR
ncbi:hypothetical protein OHR68_40850 [Spirillospora sp. NBC_00431]